MNAPLTRRSLFGATAALGAAALPVTASALAGPARDMSPEAAALLREFHDLAGRFNAAHDRLDEAQVGTAHVPEPEALFVRDDDFWLLGCVVPAKHWMDDEPRLSYGFDEQIAQLRALPAGPHERRRAERRDEIVGAWDRWRADRAAAKDASGETTAAELFCAAAEEHDAFLLRLVHMRTADPDVMRVKAAAVLNLFGGQADSFDGAVERAAEADDDPEGALCFSLMRDVLRGLGAEHRVQA